MNYFSTFCIILTLIGCVKNNEIKNNEYNKIIVHKINNDCWGICNEYSVELTNENTFKLKIDNFYKTDSISVQNFIEGNPKTIDSTKIGSFSGKLNQIDFERISEKINTISFPTIKYESNDCCDGITKRIIYYYDSDNKSRTLESMIFPENIENLIAEIDKIVYQNKFKRESTFYIEK
ncbi:hypothetical protein G6R40_02905 [Chryseobacterium sp. POL2]|uniref:hypothetical protein n=1 Tax=Chryseobacterium sp. POL2 TaxID=2713414 RepID=UPI0013E16624|nr:hypothetical protein [Chryseobacterium sp. POL2]QIG88681.1 hypothetical protein G6R40_02905 [Chryseobacterium sp. POL2]